MENIKIKIKKKDLLRRIIELESEVSDLRLKNYNQLVPRYPQHYTPYKIDLEDYNYPYSITLTKLPQSNS